MQSDIITCPLDVWLNTKIFITEDQKGLAIGKITYNFATDEYNVLLTCDKSLIGEKLSQYNVLNYQDNIQSEFNSIVNNLASLDNGTVLMFAHPDPNVKIFWLAHIKKIMHTHLKGMENLILYEISDIREIHDFKDARDNNRVTFRTEIYLHQENKTPETFYSYNLSNKGLSLVINLGDNNKFELDKYYKLEINLPETESPMPILNYQCVNIREDLINKVQIIGFQLDNSEILNENTKANFELLTWAIAD